MLRKLFLTTASILLIAGGAAAVPAHASHSQISIFQDDKALLYSGDAKRQQTLDQLRALGVNMLHVDLFWDSVAPDRTSLHKPRGFNAADPNAYPPGAWSTYDALVAEAQERGFRVLFTPFRGPAWAGHCGRARIRGHCSPDAREFQLFVEAAGRRYPSVHSWSFWNEPNQPRALQPQQVVKHHRVIPWAAVLYRNLVRAGIAGLRASGHARDQILLGETAPLGQRTAPLHLRAITPLAFWQGLLCLDSRGHRLRGQLARDERCTGRYARLAVTGIAHHPYTRAGGQSPLWRPGSGEITLATLGRLSTVVSQGVRAHRIPGGLGFWFTEYGFQSNPPDRVFGVSLANQARYLNEADWIAYNIPRVQAVAQYELYDDTRVSDFQTGLRFRNGKAKPALTAYRLPIWVTRRGSGVLVWGWVRPAFGKSQRVQILNGSRKYRRVKTVRTSRFGFFTVRLRRHAGPHWLLSWTTPSHKTVFSRVARVE